MDPVQFAFGVMTRSKSITYDNLRLRAPDFVAETDRMFARQVRASGFDVDTERPLPPMFQPFKLRGMVLANRVVVSPMCMYSARDGVPNDWHIVHYGSRAIGGAGLLFTEMTDVSAEARITPGCAGLYTDEQEDAWARIAAFVHTRSQAKMCLQLGHAGRKGATRLMWEGMDRPLPTGGWDVVAPSALPYYPDSPVPRAMTRADMDGVIADFRQAAERAERAGFDMLEVHCAHGYLLATLPLPPHQPARRRIRRHARQPPALPARGVGRRPRRLARRQAHVRAHLRQRLGRGRHHRRRGARHRQAFTDHGCDLIDVSSGQTVHDAQAIYGRMFQVPFSDAIRNEAGFATMCVGNITTADQVNTILAAGRADLVALGRPHLANPYFTLQAAAQYGAKLLPCPPQYQPGKQQLFRTEEQTRRELDALRLKAKPKVTLAAE